MGRKYKIRNQEKLYFITMTTVHWIDVFIRDIYREIIINSIKYCQEKKGLEVSAWCIMTSHIHLIIGAKEGYKMEDIIRDMKSYTSRQIRLAISENYGESRREWMLWIFKRAGNKNTRNKEFQFWQQHNHPIELSTNELMESRLNYIHNNPVAAGFVSRPNDWVWSSARDYAGESTGPIKLFFIE